MLFLNLNLMECLSVEQRRVRFIKEHSEVNQRTLELAVKPIDAVPWQTEPATVCFTLYSVVLSAMTAFSSLSTSHLISLWTKDNALVLWPTIWLMVLFTECVLTKQCLLLVVTVVLTSHAHQHIPALVTVVVWLQELVYPLKTLSLCNSILQVFMELVVS